VISVDVIASIDNTVFSPFYGQGRAVRAARAVLSRARCVVKLSTHDERKAAEEGEAQGASGGGEGCSAVTVSIT